MFQSKRHPVMAAAMLPRVNKPDAMFCALHALHHSFIVNLRFASAIKGRHNLYRAQIVYMHAKCFDHHCLRTCMHVRTKCFMRQQVQNNLGYLTVWDSSSILADSRQIPVHNFAVHHSDVEAELEELMLDFWQALTPSNDGRSSRSSRSKSAVFVPSPSRFLSFISRRCRRNG